MITLGPLKRMIQTMPDAITHQSLLQRVREAYGMSDSVWRRASPAIMMRSVPCWTDIYAEIEAAGYKPQEYGSPRVAGWKRHAPG